MSSLHHSEETHTNLVARLPQATGRDLTEWFKVVQDGPALTRFDERVHWLQDEYDIPHSYATAVVHEYDKVRAARRTQ
jgi:Domain of unknown function (DUF4287)